MRSAEKYLVCLFKSSNFELFSTLRQTLINLQYFTCLPFFSFIWLLQDTGVSLAEPVVLAKDPRHGPPTGGLW
jgi:hypothetical protein